MECKEMTSSIALRLVTLEGEVWKEIEGFSDYKVSNLGRIWSCIRCIVLKVGVTTRGTARVNLRRRVGSKKVMVTALVATVAARAFLDNLTGCSSVKHKDGDRLNCAISNLEWDLDNQSSKRLVSYDDIQRTVKNPLGERYEITNLTEFCNKHSLNRESMRRVLLGKTMVHRGWMLA